MSAATQMGDLPGAGLDAAACLRAAGPGPPRSRTPAGIIGLVLMAIVVALALISLFGLAPYSPSHQNVALSLHAPGGAHWFGTDQFGRDIFSRVASGVANSLRIAIVSVAAAGVAGMLLGVLAGYYQGIVDRITGVITNVLFAFPSLLLALALAATLTRSWPTVSLSIAIVYMPIFARVSRAPVLSLRSADYVLASTAIGRPPAVDPVRARPAQHPGHPGRPGHPVPVLGHPHRGLAELPRLRHAPARRLARRHGLRRPDPDQRRPVDAAVPGAAIIIAVIGLNLLGDRLRAALDPRTGGR